VTWQRAEVIRSPYLVFRKLAFRNSQKSLSVRVSVHFLKLAMLEEMRRRSAPPAIARATRTSTRVNPLSVRFLIFDLIDEHPRHDRNSLATTVLDR